MSVDFQWTTQCYIPDGRIFHCRRYENLNSLQLWFCKKKKSLETLRGLAAMIAQMNQVITWNGTPTNIYLHLSLSWPLTDTNQNILCIEICVKNYDASGVTVPRSLCHYGKLVRNWELHWIHHHLWWHWSSWKSFSEVNDFTDRFLFDYSVAY
jgi:hypothetical protein